MGSPYKALADNTRIDAIKLLAKKGLPARDISSKFDISKPAISNHLKILLETDLVTVRKEKQQRIYRINKEGISEIIKFLDSLLGK